MRLFILFFISACCSACSFQQFLAKSTKPAAHPIQESAYYSSLNDYQQDYLFAARLIRESFPLWSDHVRPEVLDTLEQHALQRLEGAEEVRDFRWELQRYLAKFRNAHTRQVGNWLPRETAFYPYRLRHARRGKAHGWHILRIDSTYNASWQGCWVDSIGGQAVENLAVELSRMLTNENYYADYRTLYNRWLLSRPNLLRQFGLPAKDSITLACSCANRQEQLTVAAIPAKQFRLHPLPKDTTLSTPKKEGFWYKARPQEGYGYFQFNTMMDKKAALAGIGTYVRGWAQPIARLFVRLQYRRMRKGKPAFYFRPNTEDLAQFLRDMVEDLNARQIDKLIVDLRYNSGGDFDLAKQLLYMINPSPQIAGPTSYFYVSDLSRSQFQEEWKAIKKAHKRLGTPLPSNGAFVNLDSLLAAAGLKGRGFYTAIEAPQSVYHLKKPVPQFDGEVYFLVNSSTASAAAYLATVVKDNNIGRLIGEAVNEKPTGASVVSRITLPNTGVEISIANWYKFRPRPGNPHLLMPHAIVEPTREQQLRAEDALLEWAIDHQPDSKN